MNKKNENKAVEEVFEDFIKFCRVKNLSSRTIKYYKETYGIFADYYNCSRNMSEIDKSVVEDYILYLKDRDISNTTVNTYLRGLRAFLYYAMELGYMKEFKITRIRTEDKIKETYTDRELVILLKKPEIKNSNFAHYRNWVIVNFLLATGCRSRTLVNIKVKDLDLENGFVTFCKVKNRRQQVIPLSKSINQILVEYLQYRQGEEDDYLFCNIYEKKLESEGLKSAIQRYNSKRGVNKSSAHLFRHTFAKKWILNGGDPYRLQKILGHSSMEIVKQYVNMFSEDLKKGFNSFNPLEEFIDNGQYINLSK